MPVDPENFEKNKGMKAWTLKLLEKITVHEEQFLKISRLTVANPENFGEN